MFIVGLPVSGKSTIRKELLELYPNLISYDDYLYTKFSIIYNTESDRTVILCDLRFCNIQSLNNAVKYLKKNSIVEITIELILYDKNPESCEFKTLW